MRRPTILLLLIFALCLTACSRSVTGPNPPPGDLVPLTMLPASYGELVTATFAPQSNGATAWRELWFQNEKTGQLTYVPVLLPQWKYYPKMVRTFERDGWQAAAEATP